MISPQHRQNIPILSNGIFFDRAGRWSGHNISARIKYAAVTWTLKITGALDPVDRAALVRAGLRNSNECGAAVANNDHAIGVNRSAHGIQR